MSACEERSIAGIIIDVGIELTLLLEAGLLLL